MVKNMNFDPKALDKLKKAVISLTGSISDYGDLFDYIGDAQVVLLGEATHGTHEFYDIRAEISKYLIEEKGFNAIAIEGDWPDAHEINQYVHNQKYKNATQALASFDRFPTWMWRNTPTLKFVEWLKSYNQTALQKVGFYGLDLYSLYRSMDVIIHELEKIDPVVANEVKYYYSCFEQYRHDPQAYGYAVFAGHIKACESEVIEQLKKMHQETLRYRAEDKINVGQVLNLEQNALVVKNAEKYYRELFFDNVSNWNLRDSHMFSTLNALIKHYHLEGIEKPKIIVWAHNSHVGNALATQMSKNGEYNIGQLAKEKFGNNAVCVGFTTYNGTVSAAYNWHQPVDRKFVRDALPESYEALFHALEIPNFLLLLQNKEIVPRQMLERAIGVVYRPETERASHYFYAKLADQFDAVIHCDKTHAVEPLEKTSRWLEGEIPETYPSGE